MSSSPPPYPRIPHFPGSTGVASNDRVLSSEETQRFLTRPVAVEEKLDGANVTLWLDLRGAIQVASRGGPGAMDRAGQLGPLRAWAGRNADRLRPLLERWVLYGEWLWFAHGVRYERLPDPLVGLDLRESEGRLLRVRERDDALARAGVVGPPRLYEGVLHSGERLTALLDASRFGAEHAEGLIVRHLEPGENEPRLAKLVAPSFRRRADEHWRGPLERNRLLAT